MASWLAVRPLPSYLRAAVTSSLDFLCETCYFVWNGICYTFLPSFPREFVPSLLLGGVGKTLLDFDAFVVSTRRSSLSPA